MRRVGAYEAVNLDGGASSQVLVRGRTVNRVAPGARRAVVSALIIRSMPAGRRNRP
jgi:exopolysaccharide biosynthesis protein